MVNGRHKSYKKKTSISFLFIQISLMSEKVFETWLKILSWFSSRKKNGGILIQRLFWNWMKSHLWKKITFWFHEFCQFFWTPTSDFSQNLNLKFLSFEFGQYSISCKVFLRKNRENLFSRKSERKHFFFTINSRHFECELSNNWKKIIFTPKGLRLPKKGFLQKTLFNEKN